MLFDVANSHSALRTWSAFVDMNEVILKAWGHLFEDWVRSYKHIFVFLCVCVVGCNIWALWEQSTSPIKLIHTRHTLARQGVVCFSDLHWSFRGIQGWEKWENWFSSPPPHWRSKGVRIEDKPGNCKETCLEQSDLFFFTTQIRIKTTKCNSFPPIQSILHDYPSLQNIGKNGTVKTVFHFLSFGPPPGDKQTNLC